MSILIITVTLNPALDKTLVIDELKEGKLNIVNDERLDAGTKGVNVSRVLKELGGDSLALLLTGGQSGRTLLDFVRDYGVNYEAIDIKGDTRTNIKIFDDSKKVITEINSKGPIINASEINMLINSINKNLKSNDTIVFSGSAPRGVETDIYKTLIKASKDIGAKTILDADGELLLKGLEMEPYLIKPNIHELEKAFNVKISSNKEILSLSKEIISKGVKNIYISMGGDGSIFVNEDLAYFIEPMKLKVKSTVGAGDSMLAGMIYALSNGYDLEKALKLSTACAAATVSLEGTQTGKLADINRLKDEVELHKLN
jgi:1-phosphofructokinase